MTRKIADCRKHPSEMNCSLTIIGEEEEVVRAAAEHAASVHGHEDTQEMRESVRRELEDAVASDDGNHFVQLIEFQSSRRDEINALMDEWEDKTGGKRTATKAVLAAEHDEPERYFEFVEFPTYERAMENSRLPETGAFAQRMRELCDGEPTFHNLDVVRAEAL